MEKRRLGQSEIEVSLLGLGGMSLSATDIPASIKMIHQAHDMGITYFDTADLYDRGANEELIGEALLGFRDKIILATKVGNTWQDGKEGWTWNPSKAHILQSVEASLRRLRTDYLDLYQLHGGMMSDNFEEIIETFEHLQKEGKIRQYGLSSIRPNVFQKYIKQTRPASNMMQYSLLDTRPEEFLEEFEKAGVSVLARGSLAQGFLLGKPIENAYLQHTQPQTAALVQELTDVAATLGLRKETIALKYVTAKPIVASAIIGLRTATHLSALQQSLNEWHKVSTQDVLRYFEQIPKIQYQDHRD